MSDVDTTQATWNSAGPLVDIDEIEPDQSLLTDVRKTRITTPATRALLVLLVLGVGFLGGALVDRWQRPSSSAHRACQSLISQFRRGTAGGSGAAAAAGGAALGFPERAAPGGATIGTVKLVDGNTVYIQDTAGDDIRVTTSPTHAGHRQPSRAPSTTLKVGGTVIVQGKTSSDGTTVAATTITPSTGFGRGAGGFGGAGAVPGANPVTGG